MPIQNFKSPETRSPFWQLLANAEEIQVREVTAEEPLRFPSSAADKLTEFASSNERELAHRAFLVRVKAPPAAAIAPAPPTPAEPSPEALIAEKNALLQSASLLLTHQEYVLARQIYQYLLKEDPRDADALKGLGICLLRLGDLVPARKCFLDLKDRGRAEEACYWLGKAWLAIGEETRALEQLTAIQEPRCLDEREKFDWHRTLASCLIKQGDVEKARLHYHQALQINPRCDTSLTALGTLELQRQERETARTLFERAIEVNPHNASAQIGLGFLAFASGDREEAETRFLQALKLNERSSTVINYLIAIALLKGSFERLSATLSEIATRDPKDPHIQYALAVIYYKQGHETAAQEHLKATLSLCPDHAKAKQLWEELEGAIK